MIIERIIYFLLLVFLVLTGTGRGMHAGRGCWPVEIEACRP